MLVMSISLARPIIAARFMGHYTSDKRRFYRHYFDIGAAAEPVSTRNRRHRRDGQQRGAVHNRGLRFAGEIFLRRNQKPFAAALAGA